MQFKANWKGQSKGWCVKHLLVRKRKIYPRWHKHRRKTQMRLRRERTVIIFPHKTTKHAQTRAGGDLTKCQHHLISPCQYLPVMLSKQALWNIPENISSPMMAYIIMTNRTRRAMWNRGIIAIRIAFMTICKPKQENRSMLEIWQLDKLNLHLLLLG